MLCIQAVAGIAETGVCDAKTWEALLGVEGLQALLEEACCQVCHHACPSLLIDALPESSVNKWVGSLHDVYSHIFAAWLLIFL